MTVTNLIRLRIIYEAILGVEKLPRSSVSAGIGGVSVVPRMAVATLDLVHPEQVLGDRRLALQSIVEQLLLNAVIV